MDNVDTAILEFFNQFAHRSCEVDFAIMFISGNHIVKGGLLLLLLWWGWFRGGDRQKEVRLHSISTIVSCFIAIIFGRALALLLPFRFRPLHEARLDFVAPCTLEETILSDWSSMPSDHAVLFYTLSAGMFFIAKKAGWLAVVYTTILIALPRIYLGLHYPSDIIAGVVVAGFIALLCHLPVFSRKISRPILQWSVIKPQYFYPVFFFISYQIADMFESSRSILSFLKDLITGTVV